MHNAHIHHWLLIWLFVPLLCRSRTDVWVCVCACPKHVSTNVFRAIWCIYMCICMYVHVCVCVCVCIFICVCVWCLSLSLHCHRHLVSVRVCCFVYSSAGHYLAIGYIFVYIYIYKNVPIYLSIYLSLSWLIHLLYILMLYYICLHLFMHKMPQAPRSCSAHSLSLTLWTHSSEGLLRHFSLPHRLVKPPRIPSWILSAGLQPQFWAKAKPPWHIFSPRSDGRLHVVKATPQQPITGMAF